MDVPFSTNPSDNAHRLEVTYGAGKKVTNTHQSQGTVVTNLDVYDNEKIKAMYKRVIGRAH